MKNERLKIVSIEVDVFLKHVNKGVTYRKDVVGNNLFDAFESVVKFIKKENTYAFSRTHTPVTRWKLKIVVETPAALCTSEGVELMSYCNDLDEIKNSAAYMCEKHRGLLSIEKVSVQFSDKSDNNDESDNDGMCYNNQYSTKMHHHRHIDVIRSWIFQISTIDLIDSM